MLLFERAHAAQAKALLHRSHGQQLRHASGFDMAEVATALAIQRPDCGHVGDEEQRERSVFEHRTIDEIVVGVRVQHVNVQPQQAVLNRVVVIGTRCDTDYPLRLDVQVALNRVQAACGRKLVLDLSIQLPLGQAGQQAGERLGRDRLRSELTYRAVIAEAPHQRRVIRARKVQPRNLCGEVPTPTLIGLEARPLLRIFNHLLGRSCPLPDAVDHAAIGQSLAVHAEQIEQGRLRQQLRNVGAELQLARQRIADPDNVDRGCAQVQQIGVGSNRRTLEHALHNRHQLLLLWPFDFKRGT